jgi:hypothetical protein
MFQESNNIFWQSQELLLGVHAEDEQRRNEEIFHIICWYSELCTLFDYLFFYGKDAYWGANRGNDGGNEMMPFGCNLKWRDLQLSTKMPKIHGLEDHLIAR